MPVAIRPVSADDLGALTSLDTDYAARFQVDAIVTAGSLSFFARSEHSFIAESDGRAVGFLLAQAIWDGNRPVVTVNRCAGESVAVRRSLAEAVTKSSYDAGVYDIHVALPALDEVGIRDFRQVGFGLHEKVLLGRVLGSRGAAGAPD